MDNKARIVSDEFTKLSIVGLVVVQLALANGLYLFLCYAVLFFLMYHLSQPYKPAIFTVVAINHMVQILPGIWLANYLDKDLNYRAIYTERATILSLIGLIFLFAPLMYQQNKIKRLSLNEFKVQASRLSTNRTLNCYLIALAITTVLTGVAFLYAGFTQIILSVVKIKWFFFLLFGYLVFLKKEKKMVFYLLVAFEFFSGFYSFFSEFKTVIYYLAVLLLGFVSTINFKQLAIGAIGLFCLVFLGLMWTSVKNDYRAFLNKGEAKQVTSVSQDDALEKLLELSNESQEKGTEGSTKAFLERLQYTYHFAKALERVPEVIPFQNGANWLDNIEFATTPRFLNPDKPVIDNSAKTTKYTGIRYLGTKQGVSFSLGYFAEFYIDFGQYLMMFGILFLGFVYAKLYKYFLTSSSDNPIFNYALVGAFFFEFANFEIDGTFLTGRLFASIVTFFALTYFFGRPLLNYISVKNSDNKQQESV
jgi:hypothetical protein